MSCLIGLTTSVPRWNILLTAASLMYTTIQSNHVATGAAFLADPQVLSQDPGPFRRDLRISFFSIPVQPLATLMVNKPLHINTCTQAHIYPSILFWPRAHYTDIAEPQRATLTLALTFCFIPRLNLQTDYATRPQKSIRIYFFLGSISTCDL